MVLILASASKARRRLLQNLNIQFKVLVSDIDEDAFYYKDISKLVQALSAAKAESVISIIKTNNGLNNDSRNINAVIACDSLFEFKGEIFGKPVNNQEALERWKRMSSQDGSLYTGHSLYFKPRLQNGKRSKEFTGMVKNVVATKISFENLSELEIESYVNTGEPLECAGGFAIEGKGGAFIRQIEGCYSNVIGLSLPWLRQALIQADLLSLLI